MAELLQTRFTQALGIEIPLICGAMYPCSNPELVAAVSEAGGIGIIQPLSMIFVHGRELREGIRSIRRQTERPIGFNALVERSSKVYEERMRRWVDIALEEGIRFFVTALGDPGWVVRTVHAAGGLVYHDVTERRFAERALAAGVDGLICVNRRAGGHAGALGPEVLMQSLGELGVPLVCAGGVGDPKTFVQMLELGYAGVQMGTRFIASRECSAHPDYKRAIVAARARDIVMTEKISGIPVSVIETEHVRRVGTQASGLAKRLLRHPKGKHWMRLYYQLRGLWQLRKASLEGASYLDYFQAGKSVEGIDAIEPVAVILERFAEAARAPKGEERSGR